MTIHIAHKVRLIFLAVALACARYVTGQVPEVSTFGAHGDGVIDDTPTIQKAINAGGSKCVIQFTPGKTYRVHGLIAGRDCQFQMNGATLKLNQPGSTILDYPNSNASTFQDGMIPSIKNGFFDCGGLPGSTGLGIHNGAMYVENVSAFGCTTGADLTAAQYGEYHSSYFSNNTVGMKLYADPTNGSGTDNVFYNCGWGYNKVGILARANSPYPQGNTFYQSKFSQNAVAAVASFGNPPLYGTMIFYGGYGEGDAPQHGSTPASLVIDGLTIKPATFYLNNTRATLRNFGADSSPQYVYRLESNSRVTLYDAGPSGNPSGYYSSADASSGVTVYGDGGGNGTFENVLRWPDVALNGQTRLFGAPLFAIDPTMPNSYAHNPFLIPFKTYRAPATVGTAQDPQFGTVSAATFAPKPGVASPTEDSNLVYLGDGFPTVPTTVTSDYLFSVLIKPNRDCLISVSLNSRPKGLSYEALNVRLTTNQWTRVVLAGKGIQAGLPQDYLVIYPQDSTGPTLEFTGMEMLALPSGMASTDMFMGRVLSTGAVGSNGYKP